MPVGPMPGLSPAGVDLGLGDMLAGQVAGETEEQRKRRMLEAQQRRLMGPAGTPATMALFGGMGGFGR